MKKATIIITAISILVSIATYFVLQRTDNLRNEITLTEAAANSIAGTSKAREGSIDAADDDYEYHYENIALDQKQYVEVNECMQFYLQNESFENGNNCQEKIVDAITQDRGEIGFIKNIMGDMLYYDDTEVTLKNNYVRDLILTSKSKTYLKEKLVLAFVNRYRDPIKLQETYTNYKAHFYSYIPKVVYDKVYKTYVNSFINSYDEIYANENVEAYYKDIYFKAEKLNKQSDYWFYTFWKRRELEKNDRILYAILKEINGHYQY